MPCRYALYFAPAPASAWWSAGCRWLGRDPLAKCELRQTSVAGVPQLLMAQLTAAARRYGFHATLKAPFRLADCFSEKHLEQMAAAFCRVQPPISIKEMTVRPLGDFLALQAAAPSTQLAELTDLAMRCTSYFDLLRAAPTEAELAKRRRAALTRRQNFLLERWGYPYVEEEFRFHLTLSDSLADIDTEVTYLLRKAAESAFSDANAKEPLIIDAITIFKEDQPSASFQVWKRFLFDGKGSQSTLPKPGRIFFCTASPATNIAPLLKHVKNALADSSDLVFARRTVTDPALADESDEIVDAQQFWQLARDGHFAVFWQINEHSCGIRRDIEVELLAGRNVLINGSPEYISKLLHIYPQAQVIWIEDESSSSSPNMASGMPVGMRQLGSQQLTVIRCPKHAAAAQRERRLLNILKNTGADQPRQV